MKEKDAFPDFLRDIQVKFSKLYAVILDDFQLSLPQYALLNVLASYGPLTMTEASANLRISKPAVTHLVDRLEKKGFIMRCPHERDRRVYVLHLRPKGEKTVAHMRRIFIGKLALKTFENFKAEEKRSIRHFFELLSGNLDGLFEEVRAKKKRDK